MKYTSTRDSSKIFTASEAIVKGISEDGGLIVPIEYPQVGLDFINVLADLDYPERAAEVLKLYMDEFDKEELLDYARKAYSRFDGDPCPVVKIDEMLFFMELWHGPTCAFKDMALTLMPYLLVASKKKIGRDDKTLILVATSGDTGKAALSGFQDVEGTEIIVFYPSEGVSDMQKLQMITQEGENVHVAGIKGNFDDAQTAVKAIFNDKTAIDTLAKLNITMSSANSINLGRLLPQVVYYFSAYTDMVTTGQIDLGDKVNFVVPTGNFGDILAGYYAYKMGLPVNKLIIASNQNNILTDFFHSGEYNVERKFYKTMSPSMDILISSNLERYLYDIFGRDSDKISKIYADLKETGVFSVDLKKVDLSSGIFESGWADEEETKAIIGEFFESYGYVMDPHTGVAASVYTEYYDETEDESKTIILSTASPYKFPRDVYSAMGGVERDNYKCMSKIQFQSGLPCPESLYYLREKKIHHTTVVERDETLKAVMNFISDDNQE